MASLIPKNRDRTRWEIQWQKWDGKRGSKTVTGDHATAKALALALETETTQIKGGMKPPGSDSTVGQWAKEWLSGRTTSEAKRERSYFRRHVLPRWGDRALDSIEPIEVERWLRHLFAKDLSATTVRNIGAYVRVFFNKARDLGLTTNDPFLGVKLPEPNERAVQIVTAEEASAILALPARDVTDFAAVLLLTSIRDGEARALRWECCRWTERHLIIARQAKRRGLDERTKTGVIYHAPFPAELQARLRVRWERQGSPAMGWVFPSKRKCKQGLCMGRVATSSWKRMLRQAGIARAVWPHLLRHTACTEIAQKLGPEHAQKALGHGDARTTRRYTHNAPDRYAAASADAMDAFVARGRQTSLPFARDPKEPPF